MKLFLIRHGESLSDVVQQYQGVYDDHLTAKGLSDAEVVAKKLGQSGIEIVFSSSRLRAVQTAQIIAAKIECTFDIIKELDERNVYGAYTRLGRERPKEEYRKLGELLKQRGTIVNGAESYDAFRERIVEGFNILLRNNAAIVAVVTHGGSIRCIFREILGVPEPTSVSNGAIVCLESNRAGTRLVRSEGVNLGEIHYPGISYVPLM